MAAAEDLAVIRSWCGPTVGTPDSPFDGRDVDGRLARLSTPERVSLEILRTIHAELTCDGPAILNVSGDYSESQVENIAQIARKIAQLERATGSPTVTVSTLARPGGSRTGR